MITWAVIVTWPVVHLLLAGDEPQSAPEAGSITRREELFGVRSLPRSIQAIWHQSERSRFPSSLFTLLSRLKWHWLSPC